MKRILGLVICLLMLASMAIPAFAETNNNTMEAKKVDTDAIIIDGQIDELWSDATEYNVTYVKKNYTNAELTNTASLKVKILWDGANAYILAEIKDSTKYTSHSSYWENDSFEIWLMIKSQPKSVRIGRDGTISGWTNAGPVEKWPWKDSACVETTDGWIVEHKFELNCNQIDGDANSQPKKSKEFMVDFVYNDATAEKAGRQALLGYVENALTGAGSVTTNDLAVIELSDIRAGVQTPPAGDDGNDDGNNAGNNTNNTPSGGNNTPSTNNSTDANKAPETTKKDETTAVTETGEQEAVSETEESKKEGCGSSVTFGGIVAITALSALGVTVTSKKRRK